MPTQITSPATPNWYYQPAHTGRPPGGILEDPWSPDALVQNSIVVAENSHWAAQLSNASLVVEETNSSEAIETLLSGSNGMNRSFWPGSQLHMGVEIELFPEWVVGVWTGVLVTLMVVGVTGNLLVPVVVMRTRDLRSSTNLLLVNLAAADLLVLMVSLPTALTELHSRPETWVLGQHMCKLVPFVEYCVTHASVLTILVISFERYYAICRPLRASYTCTKMRACTCILTIWAAAVVLSCPMLVLSWHGIANYKDGSRVLVCITDLTSFWACLYINLVTAVFFFVPLVLLILLYLVIGRSLMQDSPSGALQQRKVDLPNMKARKQVVVMLATVTIFFFVSLFPFRVFTLWIVWNPKEVIEEVGALRFYCLLYGARVLLFANSAVNPILYNLTSTKFREAFVKLFSNDRRRQLSRQSTFNTTGTGTSLSAGRSGSSRTIPTDVTSIRRIDLAHCGRHASLEEYPSNRPSMARYGRQSSFAGTYPYSNASGSSPHQNHRQNSRVREGTSESPFENRRCRNEERRCSGEGRRLLDNERQIFCQIQEEKSSSKACLRVNMQRREQERKIAAEMEKLLSEGEITPTLEDNRESMVNPLGKVTTSNKNSEEDESVKSGLLQKVEEEHDSSIVENESSDVLEDKENETRDILTLKENGKAVFFCESLSAKISIV